MLLKIILILISLEVIIDPYADIDYEADITTYIISEVDYTIEVVGPLEDDYTEDYKREEKKRRVYCYACTPPKWLEY